MKPCMLVVGTMGLEPMISSARGWQYTKLTYVPKGIKKHDNMNHLRGSRGGTQ